MIYGYARVSTKGQAKDGNGLDAQEETLRRHGATVIYRESFTGTKIDRPELNRLLSSLCAGDTVVVAKLDRIARNAKDGLAIIDNILAKGCGIHIINMGLFDSSPTGKLMRTVMFAFAEFERDMIVQRTQEGKAVAKQNPDYKEGRPRMDIPDFQKYAQKQKDGLMTVTECCKALGISRKTWYSRIGEVAP